MASIKQTETGLIFKCDCGAKYTIEKDEAGKLILKGELKKPDKPDEPEPKPKKDFFDSLFED